MPSQNHNDSDSEEVSDYEQCISEKVISSWGDVDPKEFKKKSHEHRAKLRYIMEAMCEDMNKSQRSRTKVAPKPRSNTKPSLSVNMKNNKSR